MRKYLTPLRDILRTSINIIVPMSDDKWNGLKKDLLEMTKNVSIEKIKVELNTKVIRGGNARVEAAIENNIDISEGVEHVDAEYCPQKDKWNKPFKITFPSKPQFEPDEAHNGFKIVGRERLACGGDTAEDPKGYYLIQRLKELPIHELTDRYGQVSTGLDPFSVDTIWFDSELTGRVIVWL